MNKPSDTPEITKRRAELEAVLGSGFRIPWIDYDPILNDLERQRERSSCKPVWTGD